MGFGGYAVSSGKGETRIIAFGKPLKFPINASSNNEEEEKVMKSKKILLLIIFILTMITFIYVSEKTDILFEYSKNCVTVNSEFEGKVKDFSNNRGTITINLYNNEIYTLYAEHNKSYKEPSFYFYLEKGDSLSKKMGDSRIFLYRNEEVKSWELYDLVERCE